jgi:uncharacterized protein YndB with AHSA1/START domain
MPAQLPTNPVVARVNRYFDATPERVFDAWLDPQRAGKFLFATPTGEMVRAEIDPRVGGSYTFIDRREGEDAEHTGEYLEIDRPRRLVFTLSVEKYAQYADRVTVDIVPLDSGCELTISHQMSAENAPYVDRTEQGWTGILAKLAEILGEC